MSQEAKRALRTVVQTAVGLAVVLPAAGGLARLMAAPGVQALLPAWLRTSPEGPSTADGGGERA